MTDDTFLLSLAFSVRCATRASILYIYVYIFLLGKPSKSCLNTINTACSWILIIFVNSVWISAKKMKNKNNPLNYSLGFSIIDYFMITISFKYSSLHTPNLNIHPSGLTAAPFFPFFLSFFFFYINWTRRTFQIRQDVRWPSSQWKAWTYPAWQNPGR